MAGFPPFAFTYDGICLKWGITAKTDKMTILPVALWEENMMLATEQQSWKSPEEELSSLTKRWQMSLKHIFKWVNGKTIIHFNGGLWKSNHRFNEWFSLFSNRNMIVYLMQLYFNVNIKNYPDEIVFPSMVGRQTHSRCHSKSPRYWIVVITEQKH